MFGVVSTRCPPGFTMRLISLIRCIGSSDQVLDQLTAEHRRKMPVGVGKRIFLGVEQIDLAVERFAFGRCCATPVDLARGPIIAAAHATIAQLGAQRRRDLQVRPISRMRSSGPPGGVISSVFTSRVRCVSTYPRDSGLAAQLATYSGAMGAGCCGARVLGAGGWRLGAGF